MRVRAPLVLAALLLLVPVASAALPWQETLPSCYASSALGLVACETTYADGTNCPGTYVLGGTLGGTRCDTGYGTHQTCITGGATGELGLFYWCYAADVYGHRATTFGVYGALVWRGESPGGCSMSVAGVYSVGCPAGAPPSPEMVPASWGYLLP